MRKALCLGALLLGLLLAAGPLAHDPAVAATARHTLSLEVHRAEGPPVLLQFLVAAATPGDALAAARRTAAEFVPGGYVSEGSVSAQWAAWGWKWADDELPVTVAYNPTGAPSSVGPQAVIAGIQAWSSVPDSPFAFRYGGITDNIASILEAGPDGENVVSWSPMECNPGCVLGVTSKETAHEVDMLLNSNPEAATQVGINGTLDWRTIILHELGHMAGLEHSCPVPFGPCTDAELAAVMHYQYRGIQRKLEPDDIAGLVALYPLSPSAAPSPGVSPTPPADVPVVLEPGWNFLVLPALGMDALASRLSCLTAGYAFEAGAWQAWIRGAPSPLQSLRATRSGSAYWLVASAPCATTVAPGP
ncbi:MAG: hypothetical protein IH609_07240 [Dehalococcoidia bacterium]|nr:hypothetical protein [Dehalococcoidia bacterium]